MEYEFILKQIKIAIFKEKTWFSNILVDYNGKQFKFLIMTKNYFNSALTHF